jgi:hypothetical protein
MKIVIQRCNLFYFVLKKVFSNFNLEKSQKVASISIKIINSELKI